MAKWYCKECEDGGDVQTVRIEKENGTTKNVKQCKKCGERFNLVVLKNPTTLEDEWLYNFLKELELTKYRDAIKQMYVDFENEAKNIKLRLGSKRNIFVGCAFVFCKKERIPREISKFKGFIENNYNFTKIYKTIGDTLDVRILPFRVKDWIGRIVELLDECLGVDKEKNMKIMALKVNEKVKETNMAYDGNVGRSPKVTASSLVYISSILVGDKFTQRDVAIYSDITEHALRNHYKPIKKQLGLDKKENCNDLRKEIGLGKLDNIWKTINKGD